MWLRPSPSRRSLARVKYTALAMVRECYSIDKINMIGFRIQRRTQIKREMRSLQGSSAAEVQGLHVCATIEEEVNHFRMAILWYFMHWGPVVNVPGIHVCAVLEEDASHFEMAKL